MSLNGGRFGGQYRSPLTTSDWIQIWVAIVIGAAIFFASMIGGFRWWTFG